MCAIKIPSSARSSKGMEAPKLFSVMWVLTQFYTKIRLHIFIDVGKEGKGWKRVAGGGIGSTEI